MAKKNGNKEIDQEILDEAWCNVLRRERLVQWSALPFLVVLMLMIVDMLVGIRFFDPAQLGFALISTLSVAFVFKRRFDRALSTYENLKRQV